MIPDGTKAIGTVTVRPTAVFDSGVVSSKLTLYVNYYGQTTMGQVSLQGSANVDFNRSIRMPSSGATTLDIPISTNALEDGAEPALGFVYEYKDTESSSLDPTKIVSNYDTTVEKWMKVNKSGTTNTNLSVDLSANLVQKDRAGIVVVYTPDKMTELARIRVIQPARPADSDQYKNIINLADPNNSGRLDPANCYVIKNKGRYMIPTFKGNNATSEGKINIEGATVKIYNQQNSSWGGLFANTVTRITSLEDGTPIPNEMLVFDVISVGNALNIATLNDGNAVIAVEKDGKTLWSWHLWFNSQFQILGNDVGTQGIQTHPVTDAPMMDRNLGASGAREDGLYYKWGDKNPYFSGVEVTNNNAKSNQYHGGGEAPNQWASTKSITDPCPPGYRVPSTSVWEERGGRSDLYRDSYLYYGDDISANSGDDIYYPISGSVCSNADQDLYLETSLEVENKDDRMDLPKSLTKHGGRKKKNASYEFRCIVINNKTIDTFGQMMGIEKASSLYYAIQEKSKTTLGIEYRRGTAKGLTDIMGYDWDNSTLAIMPLDQFKSDFKTEYGMLEVYKAFMQGLENTFSANFVISKEKKIDESQGYQVRCVKIQ